MHSGGGGGDPSSGSAAERGDVKDAENLNIPPEDKARLDTIGRTIDEAGRQIRDNTVDPDLLKKLDMTDQEYKDFVKKYDRRFGQLREKPEQPETTDRTTAGAELVGARDVQTGRSTDPGVSDARGGETLTPDEIRKLNEQKVNQASPEYRKHVEAYLRAISEQGEQETDD